MNGRKTIEAIAVGTRRSGRTLTLRLQENDPNDLIVAPTHPREWNSSLRESFINPEALKILIEDIRRADSAFTDSIEEDPMSFTPSSSTLQSDILKYQEYVDVFVSIFAHFNRKESEGDRIMDALKSQRCPPEDIFRRLVVNPNYIVRDGSDSYKSSDLSEMPDSEGKKIPLAQLAQICDVSVLRFLGNVTDKTPPPAIQWALDYIFCMTKRIEESLKEHSESGWYGLTFRKRKSTIRNSTTEVPKLALDGRPMVIGMGSPDPQTGEVSHVVPSIAIHDHEGGAPVHQHLMSHNFSGSSLASTISEVSIHIDPPLLMDHQRKSPTPTLPELRTFGQEESSESNKPRQRRHSVAVRPPISQLDSTKVVVEPQPRTRRVSTGSRPVNASGNPIFVKRKTSIVDPVKAVIQSIHEEETLEDKPTQLRPSSPIPSTPIVTPSISPPPTQSLTPTLTPSRAGLHTSSLSSLDSMMSSLDRNVSRPMSPAMRATSPLTQSLSRPISPPSASDKEKSDESDSSSDSEDDTSTLYKPKPRDTRYNGPPHLTLYTPETLQNELQTLITHNGRISLLAILTTISKLPDTPHLWTEDNWDACKVCISLIQFCVDFGLDTEKKSDMAQSPFQRKKCVRGDPRVEKPSATYSKLIVKYSLKALIHCAVSTYTGCLFDKCRVNRFVSKNASQNLNKMMHQLERLYSNSPLLFRESITEFANNSPLKRVFHFLHVILQYCPRGSNRDPLDPSFSRRDTLIVLSATVLRIVVDRIMLLNLSEPLIENSVVKEAIAFIHYSYTLFNQEFLRTKGFSHLQWYVSRVALSILLPIKSPSAVGGASNNSIIGSSPALEDITDSGTFPRRSKKKTPSVPEGGEELLRKRMNTFHGTTSDGSQSPVPSHKSPASARKAKLIKQASIHNDLEQTDSATSMGGTKNHQIVKELQREWRGLNLGVLHQRVRRLSVMMDLTEPGIIPDASLLASLISVGPPGSLIPRVLVLLECSLFVHKLNNEEMTTWMKNQPGRYIGNWELFKTLKGWGEAIGEALSACEITEKELFSKADSETDPITVDEEPVFSDEERDPDKHYIVNYSLKMVACTLLIEITKFSREPPRAFLPLAPPTHPLKRSTSTQSQERKPSNISVMSSDSDTNPSPSPNFGHHQVRQGSLDYTRKGSSPLLDSVPRFLSTDLHTLSPNTGGGGNRVSMFLRVNSRHGKKHPRTASHSIQSSSRSKTHQQPAAPMEAPPDTFQVVTTGGASSKANRRLSVSAATYLSQLNSEGTQGSTNIRHRGGHQPSVSVNQNAIRRKSISGGVLKPSNRKVNNSPILSSVDGTSRGSIQATMTPPASQRLNSPQAISRRPSIIGRMFQRRGQRRRQNTSESSTGGGVGHTGRGRLSTTTNTSSANSSPCLTRQKSKTDHFYNSTLQDIKDTFPWLDVVEHMIVSFYSTSVEFQEKRKKSCCELMLALKHIYSMKFEKDDTTSSGTEVPLPSTHAQPSDQFNKTIETSLATAFTNATLIPDTTPTTLLDKHPTGTRTMGSILRSHQPHNKQVSSKDMPRALGKLDFSGVGLRRFLESGLSWGVTLDEKATLNDILLDDKDSLYMSIHYLLETDSGQSLEELLSAFNAERLQYVSTFFVGLLHAPFSLLTYAAPVLQQSTFKDLQESSWIALIDQDYEYADAAASFFLLCCVKEKDHMYNFLKMKAKNNHPVTVRDAVTRFQILWRCRDGVWSRMEQSAPKLFKLDEETGDSIGYSLPSQLLGIPGENLPHAPWKPVSICARDHSKENVQCYQGTKRAPLEHLANVVNTTRSFPVSGSSVVQMEVDSAPAVVNSNALLELDREEYEQGRIKVKDVYKLSTVFPNDLLPLITMVIKALEPPTSFTGVLLEAESDTNIPTITQISSTAEHLLWNCMLDNPYYLFSPLLNQFNVLYKVIKDNKRKPKLTVEDSAAEILEGILKPFHTLFSHFPALPPKASHMLFNNFIGIIMRHTEQPVLMSDTIIHSVLTLLKMVVPSMKGLTMKELKNQLKKESCYTTVLTTARIRGVEKVKIKSESQPERELKDIPVLEAHKFFDLIHQKSDDEPEDSLSMLYSHYLTEEKTNRKILNSLVVQDYYPASADGSTPVFILHKSTNPKNVMKDQQELLHIHKMTELARVMFTIQMMKADSQATVGLQQEFAQPNPTFVISELQGLHSFPRKTLSSLLDEVGVAGLHEWQLRMVDTMLRGVWSKFILSLFIKVNDYQPSDNVILFLTVVNGSLLLQAEDSSTLRYSLATLLVAAKKFEPVFRQNAYQMIIPMLLRVYSLHSRNKMVKEAIQFIWACFYSLGKNTFLLQAIVSVANLFSSEVNGIASKMKVNYCPLCINWQAEEQITIVKSIVELIEALDCTFDDLPKDKLDILGVCPEQTDLKDILSEQTWTRCSFEQVVPFCVTVACFNPEVLRGMQVLVFLDHLMIQLIKVYTSSKKNSFTQIATSIRSLIKGCETLKRSIKTIPHKGGTPVPHNKDNEDNFEMSIIGRDRSTSYIKQMFHRNRSGTSQSLQVNLHRERSMSEMSDKDEMRAKLYDGFRSRLQTTSQQIVTLSRDSLLSIASQLISHAPSDDTPISKNPFDYSSLMNICSITEKVLRIASKTNKDLLCDSKGISAVFNDLLPKVAWEADNMAPLLLLVERIQKIFKKLQSEHSVHHASYMYVPWNDLTVFISCIQQCIRKCPVLVTDNDNISSKIKGIMEICLSTNNTATSKKRSAYYFIQEAPPEFMSVFVDLCTEMIIRTNNRQQNNRQRILLSGLFENALDFKHDENSSVWEKMFLPLSLNLGIRDAKCITEGDILYIMGNISKMAEHIQVVIERVKQSSKKDQIRRYFTSIKIILSAYCDYFTQEQWITIGYCFLACTSKFDLKTNNELYFEFCSDFLNFWESFVLPSRLPIFSIAWHVVSIIEKQLSLVIGNIDDYSDLFSSLLHKCKDFLRSKSSFNVSLSKRELLLCLQQELQFGSIVPAGSPYCPSKPSIGGASVNNMSLESPLDLPTQQVASATPRSTPITQPSGLKRKNSKAPNLPPIEEKGGTDITGGGGLEKEKSPDPTAAVQDPIPAQSPTMRPTSLAFKPPVIDKTQKQEHSKKGSASGSPKMAPRSRPSVSFSDKVSEHSPSRKIFPSLSSKLLKTSSPIVEKHTPPAKKIYTKPPTKRMSGRSNKGGQHVQSGFEADEEDASLETPKTSVSYPISPYIANQGGGVGGVSPHPPNKVSPLASQDVINLVKEALTVEAEVHNDIMLSSSDSEHSDDTCLDSSDDDRVICGNLSLDGEERNSRKGRSPLPPTIHRAYTLDSTTAYYGSPSVAKRNAFKASKNVNVEFDEQAVDTDLVTGQVSHPQYNREPLTTPPQRGSSPPDTTVGITLGATSRNNSQTKASKMFSTGLNQADGFLGQLVRYPSDDECSV